MPDRARKKEQKRLKRKQKQLARRKSAAVSPFARMAHGEGEIRCWWNPAFPEMGQAQIFALRTLPNGTHAMAAFLVDLGVVGLKDAWGVLEVTPAEFHEDFLKNASEHVKMEQVSVDDARQLIAGAVRFSHDNGFRLPHRWDRWTNVIGGIGDWQSADTSPFEMEFAGSIEELKQRLIGQSVESFLKRDDIRFLFREHDAEVADSMLTDEDIEANQFLNEQFSMAAGLVRQWCRDNHLPPEPQLRQAFAVYLDAAQAIAEQEGNSGMAENAEQFDAAVEEILALESENDKHALRRALNQIALFVQNNPNAFETLLAPPDSSNAAAP